MRFRPICAGALAFLAFSGCQSTLETYVGRSIDAPILDKGSPDNVVDMQNGQRAYQWQTNTTFIDSMTIGTDTSFYAYETQCVETLIATKSGGGWVVSSVNAPPLGC